MKCEDKIKIVSPFPSRQRAAIAGGSQCVGRGPGQVCLSWACVSVCIVGMRKLGSGTPWEPVILGGFRDPFILAIRTRLHRVRGRWAEWEMGSSEMLGLP